MGAQIGCEYALHGHDVVLVARRVERARARAERALSMLAERGLADRADVEAAAARLHTTDNLDGAAVGVDFALESVPEDFDLKAELLGVVGRVAPAAALASNTSSLSITRLGEAVGAPERVIGTHYLNPPLLMPPVEVVAGERTSEDVVKRTVALLRDLGKLPVVVRRDVPGFVWNRLQFALVRECAWLVQNGVVDPDAVDTVVSEGLARRWRQVGPLRSVALGGVDTWNRLGRNIVPELSAASALPDLREVVPPDGDLVALAARRDAGLTEELARERARGKRGA